MNVMQEGYTVIQINPDKPLSMEYVLSQYYLQSFEKGVIPYEDYRERKYGLLTKNPLRQLVNQTNAQ